MRLTTLGDLLLDVVVHLDGPLVIGDDRVAVTHTGELDVKDVVGYARVVLTTAAHDALVGKYTQESK